MEPDLSVKICNLQMQNPIMPASGTFGYGKEMSEFIDLSQLGAVVMKTTTLEPRQGNPQPRIGEVDAGIINSIGLQNPGVEALINEKIPFLKQFNVPIIASIGGRAATDYVGMARKISHLVDGLEVNISCPNTEQGGIAFGQDPKIAYQVVSKVKKVSNPDTIIIAKLTPNITDIVVIAKAVVEAGADAVSLINTVKARVKLRGKEEHWFTGGLSGPAIKPIALNMVYQVAQANLGIPIIGIGGIRTVTDVIDFLECGADAVQIGTANFLNYEIMIELIDGLRKYMKQKGYNNLKELKKGETNESER